MKRPNVIDLFAGAGGMSLGMEAAGFDIDLAVELDPVHAAVHHYNFPYSTTICGDISKISSNQLVQKLAEKNKSAVDVIVGGPPCQGFSQMGKRQLNDPRNQLVFEYVRVIQDLQPKYFVFENVPGIVAGKHRRFVAELMDSFQKIGYKITTPYQVLNAQHFDIAQARKRFILLGSRQDQVTLNYPQKRTTTESTPLSINLFSTLPNAPKAGDVIKNLNHYPIYIGEDKGIEVNDLTYLEQETTFAFYNNPVFNLCHYRHFANDLIYGHLGSNHTPTSRERFAATKPGSTEPKSRFFKLAKHLPCNTLRAGTPSGKGAFTAPRPIHYEQPRCISIREAARLHSYPDWFQFHRTIWHGFRQIGNSVPPLLAKSIGEEIMKHLCPSIKSFPTSDLEIQSTKLTQMNTTEASRYFGYEQNFMPTRKRSKTTKTASV